MAIFIQGTPYVSEQTDDADSEGNDHSLTMLSSGDTGRGSVSKQTDSVDTKGIDHQLVMPSGRDTGRGSVSGWEVVWILEMLGIVVSPLGLEQAEDIYCEMWPTIVPFSLC